MKLRSVIAVAITAAISAATLIVSTGSPALAQGNSALCNSSYPNYCIFNVADVGATRLWGVEMSDAAVSGWVYPNVAYDNSFNSSNTGEIGEVAGGGCLQLDQADGYVVRLDQNCVGDAAEQWTNFYNPHSGHTEFMSTYYGDPNGVDSLCLSWDESGSGVPGGKTNILRADPCEAGYGSWYQDWSS